MDKFDHILNLIKRLVELNEEIVRELKAQEKTDPVVSIQQKRQADADFLASLLDNSDLRRKLKTSQSTIYRNIRLGVFIPIRIGRRNYYDPIEINKVAHYFMK